MLCPLLDRQPKSGSRATVGDRARFRKEKGMIDEINLPSKVWNYIEYMHETDSFKMHWVCPNCKYDIKIKAPRCPECGQLLKY